MNTIQKIGLGVKELFTNKNLAILLVGFQAYAANCSGSDDLQESSGNKINSGKGTIGSVNSDNSSDNEGVVDNFDSNGNIIDSPNRSLSDSKKDLNNSSNITRDTTNNSAGKNNVGRNPSNNPVSHPGSNNSPNLQKPGKYRYSKEIKTYEDLEEEKNKNNPKQKLGHKRKLSL